MPGHGESIPISDGARLPDFVAWFGRTLDSLGIDRANIAGHSMGALICGGAAATLGNRIRRVALVNGVYRRSPPASKAVIARASAIASGNPIDLDEPIRRWFGDAPDEDKVLAATRGWLARVNRCGYATAYSAFAYGDSVYADAWPRITCPALFVTGSGDPNSTSAMTREMARLAPRGRAEIIDGHRHMVNLTAASRMNDLLAEWLKEPVHAN